MKFAAVLLLAFIAAASAGPLKIADNNVGNIVNVAVKGSLKLDNDIDETNVNAIIALLNRQSIGVGSGQTAETAEVKEIKKISPESIDKIKALVAQH